VNKIQQGNQGEDIACDFLKKKGYKIVERNFRIRGGEIDIIALEDSALVYIEVKTRKNYNYGRPEEAVTLRKIKFIERTAKFYRNNRKYLKLPDLERIDVVSVDNLGSIPKIKLFKNITL